MGTEEYYFGTGEYQKIYNLAINGEDGEKENARRALWKRGLYLDKAGLIWSEEEVEKMSRQRLAYIFDEDTLIAISI